jgi:threonine dehydrogenase-like Zn-dependent dehydrogenase
MKGVVYVDRGKVEVQELPMPIVGADEILVRIEYCALCATDVHVVTHGLFGIRPPMVMGHEAAGTVVEVGASVAAKGYFKAGDRVSACPAQFCGKCSHCKKGLVMHCEEAGFEPEKKPMDAMVEYRTYPPEQLFKLPDNVPFEHAALIEPISTASRGVALADMPMGSTVCVSGAGAIGLIMLNLVKYRGGTRLTVIDPVPEKRQLALELGAQYVIDPMNQDVVIECDKITDGMGFDFAFEMSGSIKAAPICPKIIGKCGCIVYFAVYPMNYELPLNLFDMFGKEARLQFVFTDPYLFPKSVDLLSRLDMDKLIGPIYEMKDAQKAFDDFQIAKYPKLLIKCTQ